MMEIINENQHIQKTRFSNNWEILYSDAKEEAEKGNQCTIWELRHEFIV